MTLLMQILLCLFATQLSLDVFKFLTIKMTKDQWHSQKF